MKWWISGQALSADPLQPPQDELDNLREMRETVLAFFSNIIKEKKKRVLESLVVVSAGLALLASLPSASGALSVFYALLPGIPRNRLLFFP